MKLTKLALALVAVLAMSALAASAASALTYNSGSSPAIIVGSQNEKHVFKVDNQAVECNVASFIKEGFTSGANEVSGVEATYNTCGAFGFSPANVSVNMGTCTYTLLTPNDSPAIMSKISVVCTSNANVNGNAANNGDIRVNVFIFGSECEVHVESQASKSTLSYSNNTPVSGDLRVTAEVTGIVAEKTKDNGLCPLSGTGVTNTATYNGVTDLNAATGISLSVS